MAVLHPEFRAVLWPEESAQGAPASQRAEAATPVQSRRER
jgi:hypothetical protein